MGVKHLTGNIHDSGDNNDGDTGCLANEFHGRKAWPTNFDILFCEMSPKASDYSRHSSSSTKFPSVYLTSDINLGQHSSKATSKYKISSDQELVL